jgi:phenylacetate-CoA ligase
VDLYGPLYRNVLFPLWEGVLRRRPTVRLWHQLERTQWLPLEELRSLQADQLRRLLAHAWAHVPFYRSRWEAAGVTTGDVGTPDDLHRLPIFASADLRGTQEARSSTAPPLPGIKKTTGGSTGRPLEFGFDDLSERWRVATKIRGYQWSGYRPGDRALHFWGSLPVKRSAAQLRKIGLDHLLRRDHYFDCGRCDDEVLASVVEGIRRIRPRAVICYAQAGAALARYVVARRARTWDPIPVICGAETLTPGDRAVMEQAFGPHVYETYGCREVMLVAAECPAHAGMHLSMENLVVELVVREGGAERPARPGEIGEVVLTDLHNFGMPFIRYANGDLAVAAPPGLCECGRELPRLERVEGRVTETLLDGAGRRVNGLLFNIVLTALPTGIRQWQVVQHRDRSVTLKVIPTTALDGSMRQRVLDATARYLTGVPVRIEEVAEIPTSPAGKRPLVCVER